MSALGYYVPGEQERIDIQFLPHLEGYIWVFPRCGHLSVGICGKGEPAARLRKRLEQLYDASAASRWKGAAFYSHLLPSLETESWKKNRVAGEGWMAVGDAAGLVDPITGEGLYYAIRSADLAARALLDETGELAADATTAACCAAISPPTWNSARAWPSASSTAASCSASVPSRMVQFTRRSPRFSAIMQDLFAGKQPYLGLKRRLLRNLNGSLYEIFMSLGFSRLVPGKCCRETVRIASHDHA